MCYSYKRWFSSFLVVVAFCLPFVASASDHEYCRRRQPVIFNFGDSNSDTGGFATANGFEFGYPYGRAFFHEPTTGRLSDGRLIIDFLCENVNTSYLKPYLDSLRFDSSNGVNFAVSGAATLPKFALFNLGVQINQFVLFHNRSLYLHSKGEENILGKKDFKNAVYTIDIGGNDLSVAFNSFTYDQVVGNNISSIISGIKDAMWAIHGRGGRNFWVHNTGPMGCLPQQLGIRKPNASEVDEHGCIAMLNQGARAFNSELSHLCQQLRLEMKDSTIVYVDVYSIKHDLVAHSSSYGFSKPLMACCGHGGAPYNYDPKIRCLVVGGYNLCEEGSRYISWDGIHYTELANRIVANKILSKKYSTPPLGFNFFCNN